MKAAIFLLTLLCMGSPAVAVAEDHAALEQRMRQQLARQADDLDARFQLARVLGLQSRYTEALAEYSQLLKARPENVDFLLGMAQVHFWRGAPEDSLPLLRKARLLAPEYEDVWRTQIQVLLTLGDADRIRQARLIRDAARSRFPRSDWTYARLDEPAQTLSPAVAAPTLAPTAAAAAVLPAVMADRYEWEAGVSDEALSRGLPGWRSRYLIGEWRGAERKTLYAGLRETQRYALKDREAHFGGILPLSAETQLQAEAGFSDSHRVLAARYGLIQLHHQPAQGWSLSAGWRRAVYDVGLSSVIQFSVDRYIGAERFGYTLYQGGPDGSGLSPSHRWQWTHYYGERSSIGMTLIRGRETEHAGNAGFLTSQVRGISLSGRHDLVPGWWLIWDAGRVRQGDFYTRSGVSLGLRHAF